MGQARAPWRRNRTGGGRRRQWVRTLSNATTIAAGPAAFAAASGQPTAEWAFGAVLLTGIVLAFAQYGRGYQRASLMLLGCAALGFVAGDAAWPRLLS